MAAEGLRVQGGLRGTAEALDGRIDIDADLARLTASLRAFGLEMPVSLAGDVKGAIVFTPQPSRGWRR